MRYVCTEADARAIVGKLAALDPRWQAKTDEMLADRVRAFTSLLVDVDPVWALGYLDEAYAKPRQYQLSAAEILAGWRDHVAAEAQRTYEPKPVEEPTTISEKGAWADYGKAMWAAFRKGEDMTAIPQPEGRWLGGRTAEGDQRERRCRWWEFCACTHTVCRDGWLDEEGVKTSNRGVEYPAVVPCPHCKDALDMADMRGLLKKPKMPARR